MNAGGVPNTCKSNGGLAINPSAERVTNTSTTFVPDGDKNPIGLLIPNVLVPSREETKKDGLYL